MKKAYIINLKYGIWENQLWLEADDNEVMQEKWEIAKAKLTDVATACQSSGDYFNKAIEHFSQYGFSSWLDTQLDSPVYMVLTVLIVAGLLAGGIAGMISVRREGKRIEELKRRRMIEE